MLRILSTSSELGVFKTPQQFSQNKKAALPSLKNRNHNMWAFHRIVPLCLVSNRAGGIRTHTEY